MVRTILFGLFIFVFVVLLNGCATMCDSYCEKLPPKIEIQQVKTPIFQCPANHRSIVRKERPQLAIEQLTQEDKKDPGKVAVAYKATVKQLEQYAVSLEDGFDAYRNLCVKAEGTPNEAK